MALIERVQYRTAGPTDERALTYREAGNDRARDRAASRADASSPQDVSGTLGRRGDGDTNRQETRGEDGDILVHDVPFQSTVDFADRPIALRRWRWSVPEQERQLSFTLTLTRR